jgi:hypothetical protein
MPTLLAWAESFAGFKSCLLIGFLKCGQCGANLALVVLVGAVLRISADAGVKAMSRGAPKDIDEIGFARDAGHNRKGAQLPFRN